jgi:hypothetical protein
VELFSEAVRFVCVVLAVAVGLWSSDRRMHVTRASIVYEKQGDVLPKTLPQGRNVSTPASEGYLQAVAVGWLTANGCQRTKHKARTRPWVPEPLYC